MRTPLHSNITDAYALAREAYDRPEVRFLAEKQHGAFILSVFTSVFSRERPAVLVDDFHEHLDRALDVLRDSGASALPTASGRTLCLSWMQDGWLDKESGLDGRPIYRPSAATQTVLDWLASHSRRRIVSAPRVNAIFDTVARLAALANPDRAAAIAENRARAQRYLAEAERLEAGGEVSRGSDDDLVAHAAMVADAMDQIPSDFRRVGEQFTAAHRRIRAALLTGQDTAGEVMSSVSEAAREITTQTVEGRAFMGVADLIRDEATMSELRANVARIMASPVADMFTEAERVMFANIASAFVANVDTVLQGPRALTRMVAGRLSAHVTSTRDQSGLDEAIRAARAALHAHTGPLPAGALPTLGQIRVPGSTLRLHDPRPIDAPRALSDTPASTATPLTAEYLRRWGGPHGQAVADHVDALLACGRSSVTLAEAWAAASTDLQRSVELLAYFAHPARNGQTPPTTSDIITVIEGDRTRQFAVPRIEFTSADENTP